MDAIDYEKERKAEIEILTQYGIPTLTKDLIGKTISYIFQGFIVFTDNTCFYADDSLGTIFDHDDVSFSAYLNLWEGKFSSEVIQIKIELKWIEKKDIIDFINLLPNGIDYEELLLKIKDLLK